MIIRLGDKFVSTDFIDSYSYYLEYTYGRVNYETHELRKIGIEATVAIDKINNETKVYTYTFKDLEKDYYTAELNRILINVFEYGVDYNKENLFEVALIKPSMAKRQKYNEKYFGE